MDSTSTRGIIEYNLLLYVYSYWAAIYLFENPVPQGLSHIPG
jgi:hypothetical protein